MSKPNRRGHDIVRTATEETSVELGLANGVTINISSNDGYIHLSFSGIHNFPDGHWTEIERCTPEGNCSNVVNIRYNDGREK